MLKNDYQHFFCFVLFVIFILHSQESELYRYTLDRKSTLAWELPFSRFMGHLSSTLRWGIPLSALPKTQQANLPACSPQPPINAERHAGKQQMPFLKVFWYDSTRGTNPRSTGCKADALTTTPLCRYHTVRYNNPYKLSLTYNQLHTIENLLACV